MVSKKDKLVQRRIQRAINKRFEEPIPKVAYIEVWRPNYVFLFLFLFACFAWLTVTFDTGCVFDEYFCGVADGFIYAVLSLCMGVSAFMFTIGRTIRKEVHYD